MKLVLLSFSSSPYRLLPSYSRHKPYHCFSHSLRSYSFSVWSFIVLFIAFRSSFTSLTHVCYRLPLLPFDIFICSLRANSAGVLSGTFNMCPSQFKRRFSCDWFLMRSLIISVNLARPIKVMQREQHFILKMSSFWQIKRFFNQMISRRGLV